MKLGKPVVGMIASGIFHHAAADVADTIPPAALERAAGMLVQFIDAADKAPESAVDGPLKTPLPRANAGGG